MEIGKDIDLVSLGLNQPASQSSTLAENEDTFMTLMMAQLQNQDPFKPMEGGEFLTQLAQFEMASGINAMQAGLESLASSMLSTQVLESAALVGKTVFAELPGAQLVAGGTVEGAVDVPPGATNIRLNIRNDAGELVRQIACRLPPGATILSGTGSIARARQWRRAITSLPRTWTTTAHPLPAACYSPMTS